MPLLLVCVMVALVAAILSLQICPRRTAILSKPDGGFYQNLGIRTAPPSLISATSILIGFRRGVLRRS